MTRINYKSDFDLVLEVPAIDGKDFRGVISSGNAAEPCVEFSRLGDTWAGCIDDHGSIHVVAKDHGLPPGRLCLELYVRVPDSIYPDGWRKVADRQWLDIELTRLGGDEPLIDDIHTITPYAVVTAYDLAVANGYTGTAEEYLASLTAMPSAVRDTQQIQADLSNLIADWSRGKQAIANALTTQGYPTEDSDSFNSMAAKIIAIPKKADGESSAITPQYYGSPVLDLLNFMHNHRRADMPYMVGVKLAEPLVTLAGAQGYTLSDGRFVTIGGDYTFEAVAPNYLVIYHFSDSHFIPPTPHENTYEYIILGGAPDIPTFSSATLKKLVIITDEKMTCRRMVSTSLCSQLDEVYLDCFDNINFNGVAINTSPLAIVTVKNLTYLTGKTSLCGGQGIKNLYLPDLERIDDGSLSAPQCKRLTLPNLKYLRGTLTNNTSTVTEVYLPELEIMEGTATVSSNILGWTNRLCQQIIFPKLRVMNNYSSVYGGGAAYPGDVDFYFPVIEEIHNIGNPSTAGTKIHLHFGAVDYCDMTFATNNPVISSVEIADGWRGTMRLDTLPNLTVENLRQIINRLADNNGRDTLQLRLGSTHLAKLTAAEIAIAQSKNYTLL